MAKTKLAKVKMGVSKMKLDPKLQLTQIIATAMEDNVNFPAPNPPLGTLTTLRTNIIAKVTAIDSMKVALDTETAELAVLIGQLDDALVQEAAYVQTASGGRAEIILSSGMEVAHERTPVGPLPAPQGLQATTLESEGEVETKCDAVFGANSYVFECATNPNGPWTQIEVASRASALATGLTSGTKYWFHVRAVGAAGAGPWSEPVVKMAA